MVRPVMNRRELPNPWKLNRKAIALILRPVHSCCCYCQSSLKIALSIGEVFAYNEVLSFTVNSLSSASNVMQRKFSQDLELLSSRLAEQSLTLKEILAETSERGFSLAIALLTLPFLVPVPLVGLSSILGFGCFLLGIQMFLGMTAPKLPKPVAELRLPRELTQHLIKTIKKVNRWVEKIARPRLSRLARNPHFIRWNGLCIAWLALLLMLPLPIPFTNTIPTVGILLLAIAMLESDGLLMCVSYGLIAAITLGFMVPVYALLHGSEFFLHFWQ